MDLKWKWLVVASSGREQRQETVPAARSFPTIPSRIHDAKAVISSEAEGRVDDPFDSLRSLRTSLCGG